MEQFAARKLLGIPVVDALRFYCAHLGLVEHFRVQKAFDQQRTEDLLAQQLLRTFQLFFKKSLIDLLAGELLAKLTFFSRQPLRGDRHVSPLGFLVHQFLEDDHVERALADLRLQFLGKPVVLLCIREDRQHFSRQIPVRQFGSIHSRNRPARHLQRRHPCRRQRTFRRRSVRSNLGACRHCQ